MQLIIKSSETSEQFRIINGKNKTQLLDKLLFYLNNECEITETYTIR